MERSHCTMFRTEKWLLTEAENGATARSAQPQPDNEINNSRIDEKTIEILSLAKLLMVNFR